MEGISIIKTRTILLLQKVLRSFIVGITMAFEGILVLKNMEELWKIKIPIPFCKYQYINRISKKYGRWKIELEKNP